MQVICSAEIGFRRPTLNAAWKHPNHIFMLLYVFFLIWLLFEAHNIIVAQIVLENIMRFATS